MNGSLNNHQVQAEISKSDDVIKLQAACHYCDVINDVISDYDVSIGLLANVWMKLLDGSVVFIWFLKSDNNSNNTTFFRALCCLNGPW